MLHFHAYSLVCELGEEMGECADSGGGGGDDCVRYDQTAHKRHKFNMSDWWKQDSGQETYTNKRMHVTHTHSPLSLMLTASTPVFP